MAEEVTVRCCGCPARTVIVTSLIIKITLNTILLNGNGSEFLKHLVNENEFTYIWYFILLQTVLSYFAVLILMTFDTHSSSRNIIWIRTVLLSCIIFTQLYEILGIYAIAINQARLREKEKVDLIREIMHSDKANEQSPVSFHVLLITIAICYIAFQLYVSVVMVVFALETSQRMSKDDTNRDNEEFDFLRDVVISNSNLDASSPPPYDAYLLESDNVHVLQTPPPSYATIFNFPSDKS